MEKCDCSLDNVFLCDNHPNEMCKCPHRRKTCHWFEEKDRKGSEYMGALTFFTKMLKDILIGLAYLHTKEFAHRDLKLSNILVGIYCVYLKLGKLSKLKLVIKHHYFKRIMLKLKKKKKFVNGNVKIDKLLYLAELENNEHGYNK